MNKYRRKIETIVTAIQFDGSAESYYACREFIGNPKADKTDPEGSVMVPVEGPLRDTQKTEAQTTDWIIKDEYGRFDVIGDGSFKYQYEAVS